MNPDPYSPRLRELFAQPAHSGDVPGGVSIHVEEQGMRVRLSARVVAGELQELRFRAWGCPHFIAAAEALCAAYEGGPAAGLESADTAGILRSLSIPVEKSGRILVLEDAARALGQRIRENVRAGAGLRD